MSAVELTAEEALESLTGFDMIAIAEQFGCTTSQLAERDPALLGYALVFVFKRRDGLTDPEARNAALGLSTKELTTFFAEPSEEEAGKDEELEPQPETSPSSVS